MLLSAEDIRITSERKLAVHNCSLLRSVLISTLLSNLDSDIIPDIENSLPLRTEPRAAPPVYAPPSSPDRMDATLDEMLGPHSDEGLSALQELDVDVAPMEVMDMLHGPFAPDALSDDSALGDDALEACTAALASVDTQSLSSNAIMARASDADPEALPVDIISVSAPVLTRADSDPLFSASPDRDGELPNPTRDIQLCDSDACSDAATSPRGKRTLGSDCDMASGSKRVKSKHARANQPCSSLLERLL